jgi:hypothetical protein
MRPEATSVFGMQALASTMSAGLSSFFSGLTLPSGVSAGIYILIYRHIYAHICMYT